MNALNDQLYRLPFLHWISFGLINYAENELLDFGKWKNFMFDRGLAICWDIIEIPATVHFRKYWMFELCETDRFDFIE